MGKPHKTNGGDRAAMKIVSIRGLAIPEVKVIRFQHFADHRGYFTETHRASDFAKGPLGALFRGMSFVQTNESYSRAGTVRGLHFQWNPYVGKLIRTVQGHMIDLVLDIRKGSPSFGRIIACDLPSSPEQDHGEWIWVPPGFAHGNFFPRDTRIEYLCTGEYNPACEAGISPLAADIDWSHCDPELKQRFDAIVPNSDLISPKDKHGMTVAVWNADERSAHFKYPHAACGLAG